METKIQRYRIRVVHEAHHLEEMVRVHLTLNFILKLV